LVLIFVLYIVCISSSFVPYKKTCILGTKIWGQLDTFKQN